jgi:hypothetical protein
VAVWFARLLFHFMDTKRLLIYCKRYFQLTRLIYIGIAAESLLNCALVYCFQRLLTDGGLTGTPMLIVLWILLAYLFCCIPIICIVVFIAKSFEGDTNLKKLLFISHSYLGIVLTFASLFFSFCFIGDFNDQVEARSYYHSQLALKNSIDTSYTILRVADKRPFKGISHNLWTGISNPDSRILTGTKQNDSNWRDYGIYGDHFSNGDIDQVPMEIILKIAGRNLTVPELCRYQKQYVADVYLDCIYLSIATIATVGYGDISATLWYSRFAIVCEVLSGIIIFVIALNLVFVNWNRTE